MIGRTGPRAHPSPSVESLESPHAGAKEHRGEQVRSYTAESIEQD